MFLYSHKSPRQPRGRFFFERIPVDKRDMVISDFDIYCNCMMYITKTKAGFTLIELLVVISIISILASIILVSLNSSRDRARNASAKTSMSNIRGRAQVFYDTYNAYDNGIDDMCSTDTEIVKLRGAAESQTGNVSTCNSNSTNYAVWIRLRSSSNYFCVDSAGISSDIGPIAPLPGSTSCL